MGPDEHASHVPVAVGCRSARAICDHTVGHRTRRVPPQREPPYIDRLFGALTGAPALVVILLVVGTFMDPTPAILIFTPIFLPVAPLMHAAGQWTSLSWLCAGGPKGHRTTRTRRVRSRDKRRFPTPPKPLNHAVGPPGPPANPE